MGVEQCYWGLCFVPLDADGSKFFGFSEFLAALALMVLAWTIADVRYRFRLRTAPLPLQGLTFIVIGAVGCLALLTDWWRAEQWPVPKGNLVTSAGWQAFLGGLFLLTFMTWVWFAFIRPAVFSRWNSRRFVQQVYRAILRGSPAELPEIADELSRSAKTLIEYSWQSRELKAYHEQRKPGKETAHERLLRVRRYAYDALLIIADRKFCRHVVQASPITALALFEETAAQQKFNVPLDTFAKNITSEAIANRDSFAYHEVEGYYTGYVGFHKPLTKALYGNYALVDSLGQVFDVDYRERQRWDAEQWETFCRLVLVTFRSYIESGAGNQHSSVLFRVVHDIQGSISGLYKINGSTSEWWADDSLKRLRVVVDFAIDAIKILDARKDDFYTTLRRRDGDHHRDVYDLIAELMFEIVFEAASVKAPKELCWAVQHNDVWGKFFGSFAPEGSAARIIKYKLRRLIYDEISRMGEWPNFKGSRVLGMAMNVLGLKDHGTDYEKPTRALRKAVLSWTKEHYARIAAESPRVAADCLVDGMVYEAEGPRLVKIGMQILDRPPSRTVLELDPAATEKST
ncbi:hypothetical protein [Luteimonas terricola]|uniref:DUF4760 domain-containing protein n=1 Tax=Luteimonas terricola TaxID=645597 RepID=A0ABQ2ECP5_9GAMM|nr:hypothetical protein [Luteimonas terricola]GGK06955.1 hypothetical protein GCM10011394_15200 [Luteimonas terricola]